jgi:hypothetical protein
MSQDDQPISSSDEMPDSSDVSQSLEINGLYILLERLYNSF